MDKNDFMRACREGGDAIETALVALDRSLFAVLYRECHRAVQDDGTARDLVQETFIKVWQRCAQFRGDSELLPWIRSILRRAILDRARRRDPEVPLDEADPVSRDDGGTPAARREREACFARCWKAFQDASPAHATVMAWIVEDGLTNEEIATLLGRTPGATREFISQCRKRARVHLAEWYALATLPGDAA